MHKDNQSGFAMVEGANAVVLPVEIAAQVFTLLCQGEKVSYDWQTKTYRRDREAHSQPALRMFSIADYATLSLNDDATT
jgi:hypothetical protein